MIAAERRDKFLAYVAQAQATDDKSRILSLHDESIRRELARTGSWCPALRLLDVGCGVGRYSEFWASRGYAVTGLDCERDLIAQARGRAQSLGRPIRYEIGSAERLPFGDRSFDVVYANSLLEHVRDWRASLDEWIRVLAPGGLLWIETTNALCPRQGEYRWVPLFGWWPGWAKEIVRKLADGPWPALANYSPCPARHWFSYCQLKTLLEARGLGVRDRLDCLDLSRAAPMKRLVRNLARSSPSMRWCAYLFITPLVILARRPTGESVRGAAQSA
jgi:2-polyprenyl-6-hydroxyphenyl methylase/3-demethylubiquinone-9 3-methyltransferase